MTVKKDMWATSRIVASANIYQTELHYCFYDVLQRSNCPRWGGSFRLLVVDVHLQNSCQCSDKQCVVQQANICDGSSSRSEITAWQGRMATEYVAVLH
jgi:hypothetical protein